MRFPAVFFFRTKEKEMNTNSMDFINAGYDLGWTGE
jgi:hypothetical protein